MEFGFKRLKTLNDSVNEYDGNDEFKSQLQQSIAMKEFQ